MLHVMVRGGSTISCLFFPVVDKKQVHLLSHNLVLVNGSVKKWVTGGTDLYPAAEDCQNEPGPCAK